MTAASLARVTALAALLLLGGCTTMSTQAPMPVVSHVDLPRFMGDWYVIAAIPTFIEKESYAAVETYALDDDGTIATTFTFRKGGFDGPERRYTPRGFILDRQTNATWGMRFIWPVKAEYLVVDLADDYSTTIIGRSRRDYVWIMARTPVIDDATYDRLVAKVAALGYDTTRLRKVPQRPS